VPTYEYEHRAYAKGRWYGRTIFDVFSSEFRDMSPEYYVGRRSSRAQGGSILAADPRAHAASGRAGTGASARRLPWAGSR